MHDIGIKKGLYSLIPFSEPVSFRVQDLENLGPSKARLRLSLLWDRLLLGVRGSGFCYRGLVNPKL